MRRKHGKRRLALRIAMALVVIGIVAEGALMLTVYVMGARSWPTGQTDVAIVLGALVMPNGELSTILDHRAMTALSLYESGAVTGIIACGGQGADEPIAEADAVAEYLIERGVPPEHILREDTSTDTIENLRHARAIMDEHGFESATIVTSEYHLTRALWIARDQGITNVLGAPAKGADFLPKQLETNIRETLSWVNYFTGGLFKRITRL